jgi:hypothetical protein
MVKMVEEFKEKILAMRAALSENLLWSPEPPGMDNYFLLPAAVGFPAFLEKVVRPSLLLGDQPGRVRGCRCRVGTRRLGVALRGHHPIFRWIGDPPDISLRIESNSNQKELAIAAQGETVRHPTGHAPCSRQIIDHDWRFDRQSPRTAESTPLRTHNQHHAPLGKRTHPVEAGHVYRNLYPQTRAATNRLLCQYIHQRRSSLEGGSTVMMTRFYCGRLPRRRVVTKVI